MAALPRSRVADAPSRLRIEQRQQLGAEREAHRLAGLHRQARRQPRLDAALLGHDGDDLGRSEYSAPNTRPRRPRAASEKRMCSGRTPSTSGPPARRLADLGNGNAGAVELHRVSPESRPASKCRKFIGGEPMKSATNMLAGRS